MLDLDVDLESIQVMSNDFEVPCEAVSVECSNVALWKLTYEWPCKCRDGCQQLLCNLCYTFMACQGLMTVFECGRCSGVVGYIVNVERLRRG